MLKPGSQARHQTSVWTGRWVTRPWRWSTRPRARTTWAAPHGSANTRSTAAGCAFTPRCGEAREHIHTHLTVILAQTCWVTWHKYSFLHKWFWQWVVNRLRSAAVSITSCRRLNHTYFSVSGIAAKLRDHSLEALFWLFAQSDVTIDLAQRAKVNFGVKQTQLKCWEWKLGLLLQQVQRIGSRSSFF